MKIKKRVSIIIPAYNEEEKIGETLAYLTFDWIKEIIVVNDGSIDKTLNRLEEYSVRIINFKKNRGKGQAITRGLKEITGDIIVLIDADIGKSVVEINKLVQPVLTGEVDLTIGVLPVNGGGIGLVCWLANTCLKLCTDKKIKAPLSGQRAFSAKVIDDLLPLSPGFGLEIGMDIDILKNGVQYQEVECNFEHNVTGQTFTGYLHRGKQFFSILRTVWQKGVKRGLK